MVSVGGGGRSNERKGGRNREKGKRRGDGIR